MFRYYVVSPLKSWLRIWFNVLAPFSTPWKPSVGLTKYLRLMLITSRRSSALPSYALVVNGTMAMANDCNLKRGGEALSKHQSALDAGLCLFALAVVTTWASKASTRLTSAWFPMPLCSALTEHSPSKTSRCQTWSDDRHPNPPRMVPAASFPTKPLPSPA